LFSLEDWTAADPMALLIHDAVRRQDLGEVSWVLCMHDDESELHSVVHKRDSTTGATPLHVAAELGSLEVGGEVLRTIIMTTGQRL
jgi:hypothetical protein